MCKIPHSYCDNARGLPCCQNECEYVMPFEIIIVIKGSINKCDWIRTVRQQEGENHREKAKQGCKTREREGEWRRESKRGREIQSQRESARESGWERKREVICVRIKTLAGLAILWQICSSFCGAPLLGDSWVSLLGCQLQIVQGWRATETGGWVVLLPTTLCFLPSKHSYSHPEQSYTAS